jgi:hypothetical protein
MLSGTNSRQICVVSSDVRNRLSNDLHAVPIHSLVLHAMRDVTASAMYRFRGILPWRHRVHIKGLLSPVMARFSQACRASMWIRDNAMLVWLKWVVQLVHFLIP